MSNMMKVTNLHLSSEHNFMYFTLFLGEDIPFPASTGDSQQSNKKYPILCETDERVLIFLNDLHEWVLSTNQVRDI
jgi:hypothetical protein